MKMNKVGNVVKFTLEKNIRNKWFIFLNALLLVLMVVFLNFPYIKNVFETKNIIKGDEEIALKVNDETGVFIQKLNECLTNFDISNVDIKSEEKLEYDENLDKNTILIEVKYDENEYIKAKIISKEGINTKYFDPIKDALKNTRNAVFARKYNIDENNLNKIDNELDIDRVMISVDSTNSDTKEVLKLGFNYFIFFVLMLVLSKVANEISQEKLSKSIEYVLTSINEKEYLIAKVISINLMLILQAVLFVIYAYISISLTSLFGSISEGVVANNNVSTLLNVALDKTILLYVALTFLFMVLTVIILCLIQACLSAKTTNISEAGNATVILVVLNLVIYTITTFLISPLKQPNILVYILSEIPIISMYFIPAMILVGQANAFQVIFAILLNIVIIPITLNITSKIFKRGVLGGTNNKNKEKKSNEDIDTKNHKIFEKEKFSKFGFVIGMSLIMYVFLNIVLMIIGNMLTFSIAEAFNISDINANLLIQMVVFGISLYLPYLFINWYSNNDNIVFRNDKKLNIKRIIKSVLIGIPAITLIQVVSSYLLSGINQNYDILEKLELYDKNSILSCILIVIYIGILPAIFEELFFRKGIIKYSAKIGMKFAVFASALIFSIIHLNIAQSFAAFFIGVLFACIAIYNDSIIPTVILHFLNNTFSILLDIFSSNIVACNIIYMIFFVVLAFGVIVSVFEVIKNKEKLIKFIKNVNIKKSSRNNENVKENTSKLKLKNKYMYILNDYIFVIALILVCLMYVVTEKFLML